LQWANRERDILQTIRRSQGLPVNTPNTAGKGRFAAACGHWSARATNEIVGPVNARAPCAEPIEIRGNRNSKGETLYMSDRIRLDGKVAVVTGAAGVIGTATMRLLAARGARIVAVDRKQAELKTAIKDLPAAADPLLVTVDVTREEEVAEYLHAALDKVGTIDIFFNNAGI